MLKRNKILLKKENVALRSHSYIHSSMAKKDRFSQWASSHTQNKKKKAREIKNGEFDDDEEDDDAIVDDDDYSMWLMLIEKRKTK